MKMSVLFVIIALALLGGCARKTPPPEPITGAADIQQIVDAIQTESSKLHSLKTSGRMLLTFQGMHHNLSFAALYQQPNVSRLDTYIMFGKLASSTVVRDDSLFSFSPVTNEYMELALDDTTLTSRLNMPVNITNMLTMLTASLELPASDSLLVFRVGDQYEIAWAVAGVEYRAFYDAKKLYLEHFEMAQQSEKVMTCAFNDYTRIDDVHRPREVVLNRLKSTDKVELHLRKQTVNEELDPDKFTLNIPADVRRFSF